jgi:hypothetical protein
MTALAFGDSDAVRKMATGEEQPKDHAGPAEAMAK